MYVATRSANDQERQTLSDLRSLWGSGFRSWACGSQGIQPVASDEQRRRAAGEAGSHGATVSTRLPRVWPQVLDHAKADQDERVRREHQGISVPRAGLRWRCCLGRGQAMRITVVGVLIVIGTVVLLALIADRVGRDLDRSKGKRDEQNYLS